MKTTTKRTPKAKPAPIATDDHPKFWIDRLSKHTFALGAITSFCQNSITEFDMDPQSLGDLLELIYEGLTDAIENLDRTAALEKQQASQRKAA